MSFDEVLDNQELASKLENAADMTTILKILKEADVEITEEELLEKVDPSNDQLSDENLENVSGGALNLGSVIKSLRDWLKRNLPKRGAANSGFGGGGSWGSR